MGEPETWTLGRFVENVKHTGLLEHTIVEYAKDAFEKWTIIALGTYLSFYLASDGK